MVVKNIFYAIETYDRKKRRAESLRPSFVMKPIHCLFAFPFIECVNPEYKSQRYDDDYTEYREHANDIKQIRIHSLVPFCTVFVHVKIRLSYDTTSRFTKVLKIQALAAAVYSAHHDRIAIAAAG